MQQIACELLLTGVNYFITGYGTHTLATHISIVRKADIDDILEGNSAHLRGSGAGSSDLLSSAHK